MSATIQLPHAAWSRTTAVTLLDPAVSHYTNLSATEARQLAYDLLAAVGDHVPTASPSKLWHVRCADSGWHVCDANNATLTGNILSADARRIVDTHNASICPSPLP